MRRACRVTPDVPGGLQVNHQRKGADVAQWPDYLAIRQFPKAGLP